MVPAETFETMMEHLDDVRLAEIIKQRSGEVAIPVTLDDL